MDAWPIASRMAQDKYRSVRLPQELVDEVESIVRNGKRGYKSIAEYIKEAIREKMKSDGVRK